MNFLDDFFGKKHNDYPHSEIGNADELISGAWGSVQSSPDFVRTAEIQQAYWTHNRDEQYDLQARGYDRLNWRERLRLHHLICLERLQKGPERKTASEQSKVLVQALTAGDGSLRWQAAMIWRGAPSHAQVNRVPDLQGDLLNASLTHLGSLEVCRLDPMNQPTQIDFVRFDELSGIKMAQSGSIRPAKLFYNDGRDEVVLVPIVYGLTWTIGDECERTGEMTRFMAYLGANEVETLGIPGIGVGGQGLWLRGSGEDPSMFGLGSVTEIVFPLDVRDPGLDAKARMRGLDSEEVRSKLGDSRS